MPPTPVPPTPVNAYALISRLADSAAVIGALLEDVDDDEARFKSTSGGWSILEVVCHLVDEEVEDFRPRLMLVLEGPALKWPKIDPEAAAVERAYQQQDLGEALRRFLSGRDESIRVLKSLEDPDWSLTKDHPTHPTSAGDLLASWAAHDWLHIRQIVKRRYEYTNHLAQPHVTGYAGEWVK